MRELTRHLDHIDLVVANDAQMLDQALGIDHVAAAHDLRQVGVEVGLRKRIAVAAAA